MIIIVITSFVRVVRGGGFTENMLVLSKFTGIKIGISHFMKKMAFFDMNLCTCNLIIRLLLVLREAKRNLSKKTNRDDCPVTGTQYC